MSNRKRKWQLAAILLCCLMPVAFASERGHDRHCDPHQRGCQQVPEGGSTAIYLLAGGLTCAGAMFLKSRTTKPMQSSKG
jgi:hypothetical protein